MIVKFVSNVRKQNKFAVSSNEIPPWNRLETKDIENNWRTESIQLELSFFLSFLLLKLEREVERNETKASKPLCPTFLQFTFVYIRDIHRANVPIKANSPQLAERDECCSWPFREWRGIPFPPPSYSERREAEIEGCEDEETRKMADSGQHERSRHTSLPAAGVPGANGVRVATVATPSRKPSLLYA